MQIKRWTDDVVIFEDDSDNIRDCLTNAVKQQISLDYARLVGASLDYARLVGASLEGASLEGASLNRASLVGARLVEASLEGASLNRASLIGASLEGASLIGASLEGASLNRASLVDASLVDASLNRASLNRASLVGASLEGASLVGTSLVNPSLLLLASWGEVSDSLCIELMRYDAANHPNPKTFDVWADGGVCPYSGFMVTRMIHFRERRELWSPGPAKSAYELMVMLFKEKKIKWKPTR